MNVSEAVSYLLDLVPNAIRVFGQLFHLAELDEVAVAPEDSFAATRTLKAAEEATDLILLPWSERGSLSEA